MRGRDGVNADVESGVADDCNSVLTLSNGKNTSRAKAEPSDPLIACARGDGGADGSVMSIKESFQWSVEGMMV